MVGQSKRPPYPWRKLKTQHHMPALSYKGRFVDYVEAGLKKGRRKKGERIKRQTIRNFRAYPIKPGDILYHYFAQRSKYCRKLGESVCKSAQKIVIRANSITLFNGVDDAGHYDKLVCPYVAILNAFAYADGFANWEEMVRWWRLTHGPKCFPFTGQLIKW